MYIDRNLAARGMIQRNQEIDFSYYSLDYMHDAAY